MSGKRRIIIRVLLGIVIAFAIGVVVLAILLYSRWRKPLGPTLDWPTETATTIQDATSAVVGDTPNSPESTPTEVPPTATPTPEPVCGGPASMVVLGIGVDYRWNSYLYGTADLVWLIRVDFVDPSVTMMQVPRNIYVPVEGIEDHGITEGPLMSVYFWGTEGMGYYDGPGLGPGFLARVIEANFGLRVDHYVAVNIHSFANIVDIIGGLEIFIPQTIDNRGRPGDPMNPSHGYFPAGSLYLDGYGALWYARMRNIDNDFQRGVRQHQIICGLRNSLRRPGMIAKVPELVLSLRGRVLTDMSPEELSQLTCLGLQLSGSDVRFVHLPDSLYERGQYYRGGVLPFYPDFEAMSAFLADFAAGTWPAPLVREPTPTLEPGMTAPPDTGEPTSDPGETELFVCPPD
ncbi:MAG: LCP family protein [Anaerolineales bacterium]|jgi:LCP family protein required for cell wall assembly